MINYIGRRSYLIHHRIDDNDYFTNKISNISTTITILRYYDNQFYIGTLFFIYIAKYKRLIANNDKINIFNDIFLNFYQSHFISSNASYTSTRQNFSFHHDPMFICKYYDTQKTS